MTSTSPIDVLAALHAPLTAMNISNTENLLLKGFAPSDIVRFVGATTPQVRQTLAVQPAYPARYDGDTWSGPEGDGPDAQPGPNFHFLERLDAQGEPTEDYVSIGECPVGNEGDTVQFGGNPHEIISVFVEYDEEFGEWHWKADLEPINS